MPAPTLYIIDAYAQFFRNYHAIRTPMSSPVTREPTNMTFGFVGMLLKLLRADGPNLRRHGRPDFLAVALDVSGDRGTFRTRLYPEYKAHRPPPPEDLEPQVERCLAMLREIGVPVLGAEGFEADDVMATMVTRLRAEHPDLRIRLVSKDKDLKQLLEAPPGSAAPDPAAPDPAAPDPAAGEPDAPVALFDVQTDTPFGPASLARDVGITPAQVIDLLALMGDTSDNVPGVAGVGEKTAALLLKEWGSLDNLLAHAAEVKGKRGENIRAAVDVLPLSRTLVTLERRVPMEFDLQQARTDALRLERLIPILRELGFNRYQDDVRALMQGESAPASSTTTTPATAARSAPSSPLAAPQSPTAPRAPLPAFSDEFTGAFDFGDDPTLAAPPSPPAPRAQPAPAAPFAGFGGLFDTLAASGSAGSVPGRSGATYRCVRTTDDLRELCQELRAAPLIALDTETTGVSPLRARLVGLSFSTREGTAWYVPVRSPDPSAHLDEPTVLAALRPILEDPTRPKCGHNLKFEVLVLRNHAVELRGISLLEQSDHAANASTAADIATSAGAPDDYTSDDTPCDTMVADYLIDPSRSSHALDYLAQVFLGAGKSTTITQLIGAGKDQITFDQVPLDRACAYAAEDADVTLRLARMLLPRLRDMGLSRLFHELEMPLVRVLADLEWNGILVDPAELERQRARLQGRVDEIRKSIDRAAMESIGRHFDPDSPKQLAGALFNKPDDEDAPGLGLTSLKKTKTGHSTDAEVLEKLAADPAITTTIPSLILEFRQLSKLVSTYLVALKDAILPATGRVHASFNQTVAATGRLSSSDPNLQNIPIRTDVGREIRRAFVAPPGRVLVTADYSQIELRLLAHLSRDPALSEAFHRGDDVHAAVAAQTFNVPLAQVSREQRGAAKMINFGIVYGVTAFGLARRLAIPERDAAKIIDDYKRRFSGIATFLEECVAQARRNGYVETMLKRRRPIEGIDARNISQRNLAERLAINSVVQGSAADLIKIAMVDIHRAVCAPRAAPRSAAAEQTLLSPSSPTDHAVLMLLQIHDELVLECDEPDAPRVQAEVVRRMESAMSLSVPLKADAGVGRTWFED